MLPLQTAGACESWSPQSSEPLLVQQPEGILVGGCPGRLGRARKPYTPIPSPVGETPPIAQPQPHPLMYAHLFHAAAEPVNLPSCPSLAVRREQGALSGAHFFRKGKVLRMINSFVI